MMKSKRFVCVLAAEAVLCVLLCLLKVNYTGFFSAAIAFPLEQIGWGLRTLSLSGAVGNILAIVLYLLIGLLPAAVWIILKKRDRAYRMDGMLAGISILLLFVLYYMINPGLFDLALGGGAKWMLGGTFYSVLVGYLVLRVLKMYASADTRQLARGLTGLLGILNLIFVYLICSQKLGALFSAIEKVQSGNSNSEIFTEVFGGNSYLTLTYVFLTLRYLVAALPYVLDIVIVFLVMDMIRELMQDRYSDEAVATVRKLSGFCIKALTVTVLVDAAFHILQLLFRKKLYQMDVAVTIPVFSLIFAVAALLFAGYIREEQKLKRENDLFI